MKFTQAISVLQSKYWMHTADREMQEQINKEIQEQFPGEYEIELGYDQWEYLHIMAKFNDPEYETYFRLKWE